MVPGLWRPEPLSFNGYPEETRVARSVNSFVNLFLMPTFTDRIICDAVVLSTELKQN